ncbi:carboxypeptidase regulatory-like domain-containing protein [Bythopirellula polymerisocia]|uniref:Regulatory protein BlaR1 n=1 Tax=Bythopirellula polymerisocia TaxID=2528003 RepID=A0A5C6CDY1_9BACT|nr:carboxypeptidase regulatory-like domain-containing protein [Bythopirellula polymerisocia]TWU21967.1 Regulatory protein BlaR1 [Bythopirellula polymerisocia]
MNTLDGSRWLGDFYLLATLLLGGEFLVCLFAGQPARRIALAWATAGGLIVLAMLCALPGWSSVHLLSPAPEIPVWAENLQPIAGQAIRQSMPVVPRISEGSSMPAPPLRVEPSESISVIDWGVLVLYLFATCSVIVVVWLTLGAWQVRRLRRKAEPAAENILAMLSELTPTGMPLPTVGVLDHLPVAVAVGLRKPAILLPRNLVKHARTEQMRTVLAHELAHLRHRDLWLMAALRVLMVLLWAHPLFWLWRRRVRLDQEVLADTAAAELTSRTVYAEELVELARYASETRVPRLASSIGLWETRSQLKRRLALLLDEKLTILRSCSRRWRVGSLVTLLGLAGGLSLVTLTPAELQKSHSEYPTVTTDASKGTTFTGVVTDAVTGEPIPGVKVTVYRKLSRDPETGGRRTLEKTEHTTNSEGKYSFVLSPEQASESSLYLEVEAHHPDYASFGRSGYTYSMILKNLSLGEPPFYSHIKLWPGKAITGTVVSPAGEPLADVTISMCSAPYLADSYSYGRGTFDKTSTDANGKFRLVLPNSGDGVVWIEPEQYSPQAFRIGDRQEDWGLLTMHRGTSLTGRVMDTEGEPVIGARVEARKKRDGEEVDDFLKHIGVANHIKRKAATGTSGEFDLVSLPDGEYTLGVQSNADGYDPAPLEQIFLQHTISIAGDSTPEELTIRAVPSVRIKGTYLSSAGVPRSGYVMFVRGNLDGKNFTDQSSRLEKDGKFEIKVPYGLQDVLIDFITNEHSSIRWRKSHDAPLQLGRIVRLGAVKDDISGIEVIQYVAPILLVKPVDQEGKAVEYCTPIVRYGRLARDGTLVITSTESPTRFESQPDGRWRSWQLLPDEPLVVTVEKRGFHTTPQQVNLVEGQEKELLFVMKEGQAEPQALSLDLLKPMDAEDKDAYENGVFVPEVPDIP